MSKDKNVRERDPRRSQKTHRSLIGKVKYQRNYNKFPYKLEIPRDLSRKKSNIVNVHTMVI